MEMLEFVCTKDDALTRIDKFITIEGLTRSRIQKLIDDGNVKVNGASVKTNYKLKENDVLTVLLPEPQVLDVKSEDIPLDIVYEDEHLLVVNKPQGMVVHPAAGNYEGTLVNALMHHCKDSLSGINGVLRPGIVHRIDKDTSGLLLVAKTNKAHLDLAEQIKNKTVKREYVCVVGGILKTKNELIAIIKSTVSKDFPTSRFVNFFKTKAAISVPPEDASLLKIIAEPIAVRSIAYTSSRKG